MTYARTAATVGLVAVTAALAACSSTSGSEQSDSPSVPSKSATVILHTPSVDPSTSTPVPSTTTPSATKTATPTRTKTPVSDDEPFTTTCTKLTTRIIPGGAVRGAEIAAVQYTNDGPDSCTISGYPKAVLLKDGKKVGTPTQPSGKSIKELTLQAGDVAEALIRDFSTCNAPLADKARVTVPGRTEDDATTTLAPVKLRACILRIDPVGLPA